VIDHVVDLDKLPELLTMLVDARPVQTREP
jgi:hypothetical protein